MGFKRKAREWAFRRRIQPGEPRVESQSSREFEKLGDLHATAGDPLQNSIDAHDGSDSPVTVEIGIHDGENAISPEDMAPYLGELRRHISSLKGHEGNEIGKAARLAALDEDCAYITIEDFFTVGLLGDIYQVGLVEDGSERFFWFYRAQNATAGVQDRLGSWGEGKFTLEAASRIGAQFGWSVRKTFEVHQMVLMGQTTLRWHDIIAPGDGYGEVQTDGSTEAHIFAPYGYYGTSKRADCGAGYLPLPITDVEEINLFASDFRMRRKGEPGLSVLIPFAQKDLLDSAMMAKAIIARWIFAIYNGALVVNIRHNGIVMFELSAETLRATIEMLDWDDEPQKIGSKNNPNPANRKVEQWIAALDLMDWRKSEPEDGHYICKPTGGSLQPTWANPLSEGDVESMRERFDAGENIMVTVRPKVTQKSGEDGSVIETTQGQFTVLLRKATKDVSTTFFAREGGKKLNDGMIVPFMESSPGVIAIVYCDSTKLLQMLRDSEGPAHLSWNPGGQRVSVKANRWNHGRSTVAFVVSSVKNLTAIIREDDSDDGQPLWEFSIMLPTTSSGGLVTTTTDGEGGVVVVKPPPPPPPPSRTPISTMHHKDSNGRVRIRRRKVDGELLPTANMIIEVDMAYAAGKGNAWRKYSTLDFSPDDISATKTEGVELISSIAKPCNGTECGCTSPKTGKPQLCAQAKKRGLVMTFRIDDDDWKIDLEGFDDKRDVEVKVKPVGVMS